eukprot:NODE_17554_length_937_cov_2.201235.p4 GENE.NODE_17554_length_937_cov_2.201235~~NODE_17554_length_937_cov_2.201235.p4  ORF type:complete len:129 (-),score=28.69 NODE_17554_length_937_cov_2.201235:48-434(-)
MCLELVVTLMHCACCSAAIVAVDEPLWQTVMGRSLDPAPSATTSKPLMRDVCAAIGVGRQAARQAAAMGAAATPMQPWSRDLQKKKKKKKKKTTLASSTQPLLYNKKDDLIQAPPSIIQNKRIRRIEK